MAFPSVTYTFTNGSTADGTQVNQNFTDLINSLSDGTKSLNISALTLASTATLAGNVSVGLSTSNTLTINASVISSILTNANGSFDFGGSTLGFRSLYLGGTSTFTTRILGATLGSSWTMTLPTGTGSSRQRLETDGTGVTSWQPIRRTGSDAQNVAFTASVSSNNLTIALKTLINNGDPSSTDPVDIVFRNSTATTGQPIVRTVTAATSIQIASGTTIGTSNSVPAYIYIYALDNSGTVELAVSLSGGFDEGRLQSPTAISGQSDPTLLYSATARTNVPIRLIGRIQISEATAGTWATSPTEVSTLPFQSKRQLVIGAQQSSSGTTSSTSYAAPSNTITVTLVANRTGIYRVSTSQFIIFNSTSGQTVSTRIVATVGSPTTLIIGQAAWDTTTGFMTAFQNTATTTGYYQLTAGTSYTFQLQALTSGGTLTIAFGTLGAYFIAEEM